MCVGVEESPYKKLLENNIKGRLSIEIESIKRNFQSVQRMLDSLSEKNSRELMRAPLSLELGI